MFSLRSARSLLILTTAGCWRITSLAMVREEVCHDPATGPDRYLADFEQLPIVPLDPPPVPAFPDATVPGLWGFELVLFCLLGIGAGFAAAYLLRRRGGIAFSRIDKPTVGVILLGLLAIGLLVIATENLLRGRAMNRYLEAAQSYWQENEHAQAEARLLAARDLRPRSLIGRLTPFYRSALERIDVEGMRTVNGISAVHQAIERRDVAAAERALTYFEADSALAIEAGIAALSHRSRWLLVYGKLAAAVDSARRADGYRWTGEHTRSGVTRSNLCAAWYHLTVALARGGEPAEAYQQVKLLDPPECDLDARHRTVLRGLVARSFATEYLDLTDPSAANTAGAVQMYEEAYQYGQQHEQDLPFLACDLVAALDAHTVASLARDVPAEAVKALDRSDAIIPGRPFVAATLPRTLFALGNQHLTAENFEPAIAAMDRGYRLTEGKDPRLIEGLSRAYFARGGSQVEAGETDLAIESFEKAHSVDSANQSIRRALADSLLVRGDERLKIGDLAAAKPDFQRAAQVSRQRRATARMRLRVMEQTPQRLEALARKPAWLGVPELRAEVPRDEDADGVPEVVLYYGADPGKPVAVGEPSRRHLEPRRLLLLDDRNATSVMLRDHDGDGQLDERTTYSEAAIDNLIIDVDTDWRPDVRVEYRDGVEFSREPLSGRMLMVMHEGVVGSPWADVFSQADAYVKLFHNGELEFVSDTVEDSNFPIWNQGVVVHYRHHDRIRLELWDEDLAYDDLIDVYETFSLPRTGVYAFHNDKAAIRMSVRPSDLPVGHEIRIDAPEVVENYFRDHPDAVSEYGDLIARARADALRAEVMHFVAKQVVHSAIRRASHTPVDEFLLGIVAEIVMNEMM